MACQETIPNWLGVRFGKDFRGLFQAGSLQLDRTDYKTRTMKFRRHLKNKIWAQYQGGAEFKTGGQPEADRRI